VHRYGPRAHHAPAAFGLDAAETGADVGERVGHAAGVRHLVEAVRRDHRADAYRLEQDVEALITRHGGASLSIACVKAAESN